VPYGIFGDIRAVCWLTASGASSLSLLLTPIKFRCVRARGRTKYLVQRHNAFDQGDSRCRIAVAALQRLHTHSDERFWALLLLRFFNRRRFVPISIAIFLFFGAF
jgi:hypothetical protein